MSSSVTLDFSALTAQLVEAVKQAVSVQARPTWRERLWTCDAQTRLNIDEVSEALNKTVPAVRAMIKRHGLPCRRRYGELTFLVGELRTWLARHETVINGPPVVAIRRSRRPHQQGNS